jgi:CheY-like chemotaxis protein
MPVTRSRDPNPLPAPGRMKLLCADDEPDLRTILELALSIDQGLDVEIVSSGAELLVRASQNRYDAFVLDGMMPGLDGYETCRRLKEDPATAAIPVVFLTAKTQQDEMRRAIALGATACLTKPFDPLTLATELRAALEAGTGD